MTKTKTTSELAAEPEEPDPVYTDEDYAEYDDGDPADWPDVK